VLDRNKLDRAIKNGPTTSSARAQQNNLGYFFFGFGFGFGFGGTIRPPAGRVGSRGSYRTFFISTSLCKPSPKQPHPD
jgi:hypothetical protein